MSERIKKAGRHVSQNEPLIFEHSAQGKRGFELPLLFLQRSRNDALVAHEVSVY